MQRYFIELAYDGTRYHGWQVQPNAPSVQEELEKMLSRLCSGKTIDITGCGRTDTGVHAAHYIAHVDLPENAATTEIVYKLNKMLPPDIAIFGMYAVSDEMHARFSAVSRTYRYFINQKKSAFLRNSLYFPGSLDFLQMNIAAKHFLGTQDFTSLSKLHTDVKTNICTVTKAEWLQDGEQWYFEITADRFLRNMVRATVGTLLEVGTGKIQPQDIPLILKAKDRGEAKASVEAKGLFLWRVEY